MTSQAVIDANRRNAQKSTGPRTRAGKAKSAANAIKDGLRSRRVAAMREDSYDFENQKLKWMANNDPRNDTEEFLIFQNLCVAFELKRAHGALLARTRNQIENHDEIELKRAKALGKRLFHDPAGPTGLYGNGPDQRRKLKKTSGNGEAVDPNDPEELVKELEGSREGCYWLIERWEALRDRLDGGFWRSIDRFMAIRLIGLQPVDSLLDRRVAEIIVASHAIHRVSKNEFKDLLSDMTESQCIQHRKDVKESYPDLVGEGEPDKARQILIDLAEEHLDRLSEKLEAFNESAEADHEESIAHLKSDDSREGERLFKKLVQCKNSVEKGLEGYRKRRAADLPGGGGDGRGARETRRERESLRVSSFESRRNETVDLDWAKELGRGGDAAASDQNVLSGILGTVTPTEFNDTTVSDGVTLVQEARVESEPGAGELEGVGCDLSEADAVVETPEDGAWAEDEKVRDDTNEPVFSEHSF